jgi:hypothetical protein
MATNTTVAQKTASVHSMIQGSTLAAPPTASHAALAAVLKSAGVLSPAGAYAAGKGQADLQRILQVPEILQEIAHRQANALGV